MWSNNHIMTITSILTHQCPVEVSDTVPKFIILTKLVPRYEAEGRLQTSSPENDVDRLKPWGDVGLGDLWSVGLQQMRFGGFDIRDRCCQTLPQTQQVVNTVGGKLPVLTHRRRETGEGPTSTSVSFIFASIPKPSHSFSHKLYFLTVSCPKEKNSCECKNVANSIPILDYVFFFFFGRTALRSTL